MADNNTASQETGFSALSKETPLSWSVSEQIFEQIDSDIKINRLLATYHPDDGLAAYERLLKAFGTSSENVTTDTWQQLISTLPLPNGTSENDVREVICNVTGLSRDNLIFSTEIESLQEEQHKKKVDSPSSPLAKKNIEYQDNLNNDSFGIRNSDTMYIQIEDERPEVMPSVSEEFLGFPSHEIPITASRIQKTQDTKYLLTYGSPCLQSRIGPAREFPQKMYQQDSSLTLKWTQSPRFLRKSNPYRPMPQCRQAVLKTLNNKYIRVPIAKINNYNQILPNMRRTSCVLTQVSNNEAVTSKTDQTSVNMEGKKCETRCSEFDFKLDCYSFEKFDGATRLKQQEDIRKMDFVRWNEESENISSGTQNSPFEAVETDIVIVSDRLRNSIQNFFKRVEQDVLVEPPAMPAVKSLATPPRTVSSSVTHYNYINSNVNSKQNSKPFIDTTGYVTTIEIPKKQKDNTVSDKMNGLLRKRTIDVNKSRDSHENNSTIVQNSTHRMNRAESNNRIILQQTSSVPEFATYKKQYCDSLLNFQQTKVIGNSMSSVESPARHDPCYSTCGYQRPLLRREEQLLTNPQFAVHAIPQSTSSHVYSAPCTWLRCSNWRHPVVGELKFQQQSSLSYGRSKQNKLVTNCSRMTSIQSCVENRTKQVTQCVQTKKKLEDIVGMLKDDNVNTKSSGTCISANRTY